MYNIIKHVQFWIIFNATKNQLVLGIDDLAQLNVSYTYLTFDFV